MTKIKMLITFSMMFFILGLLGFLYASLFHDTGDLTKIEIFFKLLKLIFIWFSLAAVGYMVGKFS
jgi:hypothetical protein